MWARRVKLGDFWPFGVLFLAFSGIGEEMDLAIWVQTLVQPDDAGRNGASDVDDLGFVFGLLDWFAVFFQQVIGFVFGRFVDGGFEGRRSFPAEKLPHSPFLAARPASVTADGGTVVFAQLASRGWDIRKIDKFRLGRSGRSLAICSMSLRSSSLNCC